jgi:hypothetical protein
MAAPRIGCVVEDDHGYVTSSCASCANLRLGHLAKLDSDPFGVVFAVCALGFGDCSDCAAYHGAMEPKSLTQDPSVREALVTLLTERGAAELPHVIAGTTLLDHFERTEQLLRSWGNPEPVCLAGLCHAAYSSDGFEGQVVDHTGRETIAQVAGRKVEAIVYLYGSCDGDRVYPQIGHTWPVRFRDRFDGSERDLALDEVRVFCELKFANALELLASRPDRSRLSKSKSDLYRAWLPFVSSAARTAFEASAKPPSPN